MSKDIRFYLEQPGVQEVIYHGSQIKDIERDVMEKALAEAQASFLNEFGFPGNFQLEFEYKPVGGKGATYIPGGTRPVYRIVTNDARTSAAIRKNPGWLERFSRGVKM